MNGAPEVRPRTVAELAGDALALTARHLWPLVAAAAVVWLPCSLLGAIALAQMVPPDLGHLLALAAAGKPSPELQADVARWQPLGRIEEALALGLSPLGNVAVIVLAASFLDGGSLAPLDALRRAARVWVAGIVVAVAFWLLTMMLGGAAAVVFGISSLPLLFLAVAVFHARNAMVLALVTLALPALAALIVVGVVQFATVLAYVALATENPNPIRTALATLRRVRDVRFLGRTLLAALAYLAGSLVLALGSVAVWIVAAPLHAIVPLTLALSAVACVVYSALLVFVLLFSRDLALRRGDVQPAV